MADGRYRRRPQTRKLDREEPPVEPFDYNVDIENEITYLPPDPEPLPPGESRLDAFLREAGPWLAAQRVRAGHYWRAFAAWATVMAIRFARWSAEWAGRLQIAAIREWWNLRFALAVAAVWVRGELERLRERREQSRRLKAAAPPEVSRIRRAPASTASAQPEQPQNAVPPPTLRAVAVDAWRAEEARQIADRIEWDRHRAAREAAALRSLLAERLGLQANPGGGRAAIDDLTFAVRWNAAAQSYDLVLMSTCPSCGAPVTSGDITCLADLGRIIEDIGNTRHVCDECRTSSRPEESSTEERLARVLRELLAEERAKAAEAAPMQAGTGDGAYHESPNGARAVQGRPRKRSGSRRPRGSALSSPPNADDAGADVGSG